VPKLFSIRCVENIQNSFSRSSEALRQMGFSWTTSTEN